MKITSLTLHNFRCVEDLTLDLDRPLTVIAGLDNGDGKTTILEGIALAATALYGRSEFPVDPGLKPDWPVDLRVNEIDGIGPLSVLTRIESDWGTLSRGWFEDSYIDNDLSRETQEATYIDPEQVRALHDARKTGQVLPLVVYYSTDRGTIAWAKGKWRTPDELVVRPLFRPADASRPRLPAFENALSARADLGPTITWFLEREAQELRQARELREAGQDNYSDPLLNGLRKAVRRALPQCQRIRGASTTPPQIAIDWAQPDGTVTTLGLRQLSGGTRTQLALVLDLARRMCQANPKQGVDGEALVLIDEIDLHLHPKWQQTVVGQLQRAFPNVQFIMTTHSDQVLSSVKPESILLLDRRSGALTVRHPEHSYGRRSEDILEDEMGTPARAALEDELAEYASLVAQGEGRSDAAIAQRQALEHDLPVNDEALRRADNELRRQQFLASMKAQ